MTDMPTLNASSRIMFLEALQRGIECTTFGDHETILMKKDHKQWYTRGSRHSLQSAVGQVIADNKVLTKKVLHHFGLPTARFVAVKSETELEQLNQLRFPIVMKPVAGAHGKNVIVGIQTLEEARQEFSAYNQPVLFEEMLKGTEYRVICVNFKFVAAALRKPAFVTGDGQHTIADLINQKNQHPWRKPGHEGNLTLIEVDHLVEEYLTEQGMTTHSVPAAGQEVPLRRTANLSTGGEAWNVTELVSPENRRLFEHIARACDLHVIGIDVMCDDLQQSLLEQPQAGILEVNKSPGLRMHHYPLQGEPINVAGLILEYLESHIQPSNTL